jgi:hypothetical protein
VSIAVHAVRLLAQAKRARWSFPPCRARPLDDPPPQAGGGTRVGRGRAGGPMGFAFGGSASFPRSRGYANAVVGQRIRSCLGTSRLAIDATAPRYPRHHASRSRRSDSRRPANSNRRKAGVRDTGCATVWCVPQSDGRARPARVETAAKAARRPSGVQAPRRAWVSMNPAGTPRSTLAASPTADVATTAPEAGMAPRD